MERKHQPFVFLRSVAFRETCIRYAKWRCAGVLLARNKGRRVIEGAVLTRHSGDQINNNIWARHVACMRKMRSAFRVVVERDNLEEVSVDGRIILKWIFNKWKGSKDWIDLAQDTDRWRSLVNAVMNLRVPESPGNFLTS